MNAYANILFSLPSSEGPPPVFWVLLIIGIVSVIILLIGCIAVRSCSESENKRPQNGSILVVPSDLRPEYPDFGDISSSEERIYEDRTFNFNDGYSSHEYEDGLK